MSIEYLGFTHSHLSQLEIIGAVALWQADAAMHPLTCGTDSRHGSLVPFPSKAMASAVELICLECPYVQRDIPEVVLAWASRYSMNGEFQAESGSADK